MCGLDLSYAWSFCVHNMYGQVPRTPIGFFSICIHTIPIILYIQRVCTGPLGLKQVSVQLNLLCYSRRNPKEQNNRYINYRHHVNYSRQMNLTWFYFLCVFHMSISPKHGKLCGLRIAQQGTTSCDKSRNWSKRRL